MIWVLIAFVPLIGAIVPLLVSVTNSTTGPNRSTPRLKLQLYGDSAGGEAVKYADG